MIQQDMLYKPSLNYLKKERFTGSYSGMRYLLEKRQVPVHKEDGNDNDSKEHETETLLFACHWPEPFNYEHTEKEQIIEKSFAMSQEGLEAAWTWLGESQESYQ